MSDNLDLFAWAAQTAALASPMPACVDPEARSQTSAVVPIGGGRLTILRDHRRVDLNEMSEIMDRDDIPECLRAPMIIAFCRGQEIDRRERNRRRAAGLLRHQAEKKRQRDASVDRDAV
jgi:hypothetical protein